MTDAVVRYTAPNGSTWCFQYAAIYCPRCGHHGIWLEGEDFYVGATGHCLACQHTHQCAGDFAPFGEFEHGAAAVLAQVTAQEDTP
jgi:hypothetical protein